MEKNTDSPRKNAPALLSVLLKFEMSGRSIPKKIGTRGRAQGLKKDRKPPPKAVKTSID